MAAAVADYQPEIIAKSKIKKESKQNLTLKLVKTPDILSEVKGDFIKVGFAAESENLVANARKKLASKKLDMIVANDITQADSGFDVDTNRVVIIDKKGKAEELPLMSKREVAEKILDRVKELFILNHTIMVHCKIHNFGKNKKYYRIEIPKQNRSLFPGKGILFNIKSKDTEDRVRIMEDAPQMIPHIHLNKTNILRSHPTLKNSQSINIKIIDTESGKEYLFEEVN